MNGIDQFYQYKVKLVTIAEKNNNFYLTNITKPISKNSKKNPGS